MFQCFRQSIQKWENGQTRGARDLKSDSSEKDVPTFEHQLTGLESSKKGVPTFEHQHQVTGVQDSGGGASAIECSVAVILFSILFSMHNL